MERCTQSPHHVSTIAHVLLPAIRVTVIVAGSVGRRTAVRSSVAITRFLHAANQTAVQVAASGQRDLHLLALCLAGLVGVGDVLPEGLAGVGSRAVVCVAQVAVVRTPVGSSLTLTHLSLPEYT